MINRQDRLFRKCQRASSKAKVVDILTKEFNYVLTKMSNHNSFRHLKDVEQAAIKESCLEKLKVFIEQPKVIKPKKTFSLWSYFSCEPEVEVINTTPDKKHFPPIHDNFFKMLKIVKSKCLTMPKIFRIEGDRKVSRALVERIWNGEADIDFSPYNVITLSAAVKTYIREYLDGLYAPEFIKAAIKYQKQNRLYELDYMCKLYLFSLPTAVIRIFVDLQKIVTKLSQNIDKSEMTMESCTNILCLTLTPQCFFTDLTVLSSLTGFQEFFMNVNMDTINFL